MAEIATVVLQHGRIKYPKNVAESSGMPEIKGSNPIFPPPSPLLPFPQLAQPANREAALASPEHMAKAALLMITNNVGSLAMLHATPAGVNRILFAGSFMHDNRVTEPGGAIRLGEGMGGGGWRKVIGWVGTVRKNNPV